MDFKIKTILTILVLVFAFGCTTQANDSDNMMDDSMVDAQMPVPDGEEMDEMMEEVMGDELAKTMEDQMNAVMVSTPDKTFIVTGENFKFFIGGVENPDIIVNKGDLVRIEFESTSGFHDWVVDEFSAATEKVKDGGATFVEFSADKTGTFEYYCSVGSHRANGMSGNFIVK